MFKNLLILSIILTINSQFFIYAKSIKDPKNEIWSGLSSLGCVYLVLKKLNNLIWKNIILNIKGKNDRAIVYCL